MNREYHKWWSPQLEREMEILVFGHNGAKVLVFPTRGARFYEYEQLRMVDVLREKIEQGWIQLYCVDSVDTESLYCWWAHPEGRINRHQAYEDYILKEVLPFMAMRNSHPCTISHGCSLGAFHALNIAFRHPHLFQKLVAFSGRYDLTTNVEWFGDLFDGYYNESIYFHTPVHFLPGLTCEHRLDALKRMEITLVVGKEDPFLDNNRHLSGLLNDKGISHHLHLWDDRAHRGYYWRRMAPIYV